MIRDTRTGSAVGVATHNRLVTASERLNSSACDRLRTPSWPLQILVAVFTEGQKTREDSEASRLGAGAREARSRAALVAGYLSGDPAGREALARHVLSIALRTAMAMHPDRELASDAAQEVAIVALRDVGRLKDPTRLDAWLHTLCVRRLVRARRAYAHRIQKEVVLDELVATEPREALVEDIASRAVRGPLRELPPRQRAAIILRYVHDLREADIAEILGCRPGTSAALLSRARRALRADAGLQSLACSLGLEVDDG